MIKLCYKEYDFKVSLAACKAFFDKTGQDLPSVLIDYLVACKNTVGMDDLQRMGEFHKVANFFTASHAIHALIGSKDIPLSEIQDGMHRVGWLPNGNDDDLSEPWPLVMLDIATQYNNYYETNIPVKKKDI